MNWNCSFRSLSGGNGRMNNLKICFFLFLSIASVGLYTPHSGAAESSAEVVIGKDGWLFLRQELRFLNAGKFWGDSALSVSRAKRDDAKDPTPAILAFHRALASKGVTLLLVPVPPKALLYPEYVPDNQINGEWGASLDHYYEVLRESGVHVLDLREDFTKLKWKQRLFCQTDTHWSGYGSVLAADLIAKELEALLPVGSEKYSAEWRDIQIHGDLAQMLETKGKERETISIRDVFDGSASPLQSDETSPILVLGDSHVLVFHDGKDMFAKGAGLSDQLALAVARPVEVIGVRGSGATPARLNVYRKAQRNAKYWNGKKIVVWCFAAREFTETDGWRVLPIEP